MELVVTVNGPGETAGWLAPLVAALARRAPGVSITTVVTPCQLASGRESDVLAELSGVSRVERLGPYLREAARARLSGTRSGARLVLHLGGDHMYAVLIGRILRAPVWTYGTSARFRRSIARFLVPDERTARKLRARRVPPNRIEAVGQLVTDSVLRPRRAGVVDSGDGPTVAFLPGSREAQVRFMAPFYAAVIEQAHAAGCRMRSIMVASHFVPLDLVASSLVEAGWTVTPREQALDAVSPLGPSLRVVRCRIEDVADADLAVTIPGTNTLQLAALAVPHLMLAPLQQSELIAFTGVLGLLKPTWWGAVAIRRAVIERLNRRLEYLAIPNIIAGEEVVPEMRGMLEAASVAARVAELLAAAEQRRAMAVRLKEVAGPPGAADRIVDLMRQIERPPCASAS